MAVPASITPARAYGRPEPERSTSWPQLASGVLDLLPDAVLVVARDLRVLGRNRAAVRLLREADGLLVAPGGLVTATLRSTAELRESVESASRGETRRMQVPRTHRAPLSLLVEPHPQGLAVGGAAVIFASDPERGSRPSAHAFGSRYGFTRAECEVTQRLAAGVRLERIAAELDITLHTVRGHLKHAFVKAHVHRQAELVARLLSEG